jgi:transcriptional regulator with XRE-family HTH domain
MLAAEQDLLYRMIGDRIREARERSGMTQTALAGKLTLSRVSIVNIEKGRQRAPLHVLWQIAELVNIELTVLIPRQRELVDRTDSIHLDSDTVAQIEAAAKGDPATHRKLTEFIKLAKSTSRSTNQ